MTERIQRLAQHIQDLNGAGVRRTLFYPLAAQSLIKTQGESLQLRRAKAQAHILDHAPLAVLPHELIVGSISAFCLLLTRAPDEAHLAGEGARVVGQYLERKRAGHRAEKPRGIRTFSDEFGTKQSRWALMSRVHHDSSIRYDQLQRLIKQMKDEYHSEPDLEPYEIGRELERAFKIDYGEAKRTVDSLPWFAANHLSLSYESALDEGLRGLEQRVLEGLRLAKTPETVEFYTAQRIVVQAAQRFILRYANAVSGEAGRAQGTRSEELSHMAAALRKIATERADTFYEGLQLTWCCTS